MTRELACVPGSREFAGELSAAHGALQRVAIERGLEFDFHGIAVASLALLGPGNGVARNGRVSGVIAAGRLVSDREFIAVFRDGERLRATTAAVPPPLPTGLNIALTPPLRTPLTTPLTTAATAARDGHVPATHKIGVLRCGLECRQRKQQGDEINNRESQPKFFHGTISPMLAAATGARRRRQMGVVSSEPAFV